MEADGRREKFLDQVRARAGLLGEGGAPQRKRERLSKKAQALVERIEAAEAKRKSVLASKAMRASKLGSERVERSRYKMTMENAIQDCARVCRIRAAEERRYKVRPNIQTFGSLQKKSDRPTLRTSLLCRTPRPGATRGPRRSRVSWKREIGSSAR